MLFVQRAHAVNRDFILIPANAQTIALICRRLDGLPLSIELAATRIKLLSPQGLLTRLSSRLALLTWGAHDLPARQQTLRTTLDWSYDLLDPMLQRLFAQLAVFMGSWTLEAAEVVAEASENDQATLSVLDGLMGLADSSLISNNAVDYVERRYGMLETIREYAFERLMRSGTDSKVRQRHTAYFLSLVEQAEHELTGPQQVGWLMRLELKHANIRAALRELFDRGPPADAARLGGALMVFWLIRGYLSEGRQWLATALAQRHEIPAAVLAKAFLAAGRLAREQSDLEQAAVQLNESLALYRDLEDWHGIALVLGYLGVIAYDKEDFGSAALLHNESLSLRRALGDHWGVATTLGNLGEVARQQGNLEEAAVYYDESLTLFRRLGNPQGMAVTLTNLGMALRDQGQLEQATALLGESLTLWQQLEERSGIAESLEALAGVAVDRGQSVRAARLGGTAERLRTLIGVPLPPADRTRYQRYLDRAQAQLGSTAFARAWAEGQAMSVDQAVGEAIRS